jgi:hypothetical protein
MEMLPGNEACLVCCDSTKIQRRALGEEFRRPRSFALRRAFPRQPATYLNAYRVYPGKPFYCVLPTRNMLELRVMLTEINSTRGGPGAGRCSARAGAFRLASPNNIIPPVTPLLQSLHVHEANEAAQGRPAVMVPGERRMLHLTDFADPVGARSDRKAGELLIDRGEPDGADLPSQR